MKEEKKDETIKDHLETKADEFIFRLRKEKRLDVPKLQKQLGISDEIMEKWIIVFEENGLLERIYPANPFRPAYLVIKNV